MAVQSKQANKQRKQTKQRKQNESTHDHSQAMRHLTRDSTRKNTEKATDDYRLIFSSDTTHVASCVVFFLVCFTRPFTASIL